MATLEQVEKLREKTGVSYEEAKAALEASGDDLLDAVINLERQGRIKKESGFYSGEKAAAQDAGGGRKEEGAKDYGQSLGDLLRKFGTFCLKLIHKGNVNTFEVIRNGESKAAFPVTVLVLLIVFLFWVTVPLLIVGMFFGFRYRFCGPDLGKDSVNGPMDSAANAAEEFKKSITK